MNFLKPFEDLNKHSADIAGGKGASLGEMTQAGIPVPEGFVVLSTTFDKFLQDTDLVQEIDAILEKVDHKEIHTVEDASEKIQELIKTAKMPEDISSEIEESFKTLGAKYVAVRSSATAEDGAEHAWAGQLESFLNTTEDNLLEKVQHCWASLFTPRAIFYRFEKDLHKTKISVAVVVQKMVQSEISGIAFSVHPITEDPNQLIIEAGFGLGEAIVSGSITPDSYVVEKDSLTIVDINVNTQNRELVRSKDSGNEWIQVPESRASSQVLNEKQIIELSNIVINIEKHYGFPCDIEWAFEKGKFYIVQSRPITTLSNKAPIQNNSIKLSKIYSREKALFYFCMWNESDRMGYKDFLGYEVKNNLFLVPPSGQKGSVWYSPNELADIDVLLRKTLKSDEKLIAKFKERLDSNWKVIFPYLAGNKIISSVDEFNDYYLHLVQWWSAMNTAFTIPDMQEVAEEVRKTFLEYRMESEKYTEQMNKVLINFWNERFPNLNDLTMFVAPHEVSEVEKGDEQVIAKIKERKEGCFMLNGEIYPMRQLNSKLNEAGILLENETVDVVEEIKGSTAYKGIVRGKVRKILGFKDMDDFVAGEILVTEMTNPDYLPIMKMAAAVVTDEGGATCHAAIACRELKIPGIVGTKVSTKVLKDGDEVEVDADNGIVKVIK